MTAAAFVIVQSPDEFRRLTGAFQDRLKADAAFRALMETVCGGPDALDAFAGGQSRSLAGLGMSEFAALVALPTSTVRHYQRLGLITPYEVNGKFRFWIHNLIQVESVKQWRDLGLSLEDIQALRSEDRLGGQAVTFNPTPGSANAGGLSALVTEKAVSFGVPRPDPEGPMNSLRETVWLPLEEQRVRPETQRLFPVRPAEDPILPDADRLLSEIRAARERLESRLRVLQAQVAQAYELERALVKARRGADPARGPADRGKVQTTTRLK